MTKKHWFIIAAVVLVFGGIGMVLAFALGFFAGHEEAAGGAGLPFYTMGQQSPSTHPGYLHDTVAGGGEVYVHDYEEACLQLTVTEPQTVIGLMGSINPAKVGAVPGQPVTAYIMVDCGGEMPAYAPYRNVKQPPFDWRTASFRQVDFLPPGGSSNWRQSTNAALITEIVRVLHDGAPVELPGVPFTGMNTNLSALKLTCDQLPGLLFCPSVYFNGNGTIYLAESETIDWTPKPAQLHARWIPASPLLTEWLKTP